MASSAVVQVAGEHRRPGPHRLGQRPLARTSRTRPAPRDDRCSSASAARGPAPHQQRPAPEPGEDPRSDGGGCSTRRPRSSAVNAVELVDPARPVQGLEPGHPQLDVAVGHLPAVPGGRRVEVVVEQRQPGVDPPLGAPAVTATVAARSRAGSGAGVGQQLVGHLAGLGQPEREHQHLGQHRAALGLPRRVALQVVVRPREHVEGLGRPVEVEEQVARPGQRHPGDLLGVGGRRTARAASARRCALARQRLAQDQAGVGPAGAARGPARRSASRWSSRPSASRASGSSCSGSPGRPDSSRQVATRSRSNRRGRRPPDQVAQQRPAPQPGQAGGQHLAVERVGHLHASRPAGVDDLDQAPLLQRLEVGGVDASRSAAASGTCSPTATISSAARRSGSSSRRRSSTRSRSRSCAGVAARSGRPPPVARRSTAAVTSSRTNRALPRLSCQIRSSSDAGHPVAQHGQHQLLGGLAGQGPTSSAGQQLVLPQRHEALGQRLAGAHAHQHPHRRLGQRQVEQRHRHLVEQVGVVDGQHEAAGAGPLPQPGQRQVEQVVGWWAPSAGARRWANDPSGISRAASVARTHSTAVPASRSASTASSTSASCRPRPRRTARLRGRLRRPREAAQLPGLSCAPHERPPCDHARMLPISGIRRSYGSPRRWCVGC